MESFCTHSITALSKQTHTHWHLPQESNLQTSDAVAAASYETIIDRLFTRVSLSFSQHLVCRHRGLHQPGLPVHGPGAGHDTQWALCPFWQVGVGKENARHPLRLLRVLLFHLYFLLHARKTTVCVSRFWVIVITACLDCRSHGPTTPTAAWRWALTWSRPYRESNLGLHDGLCLFCPLL